ncbi:hypothetical protein RZ532_13790 [Nitratireductor aquimarinus]|uniref:hypothetical protein n=1 Tax=Nitratireductor aquimarinus TaxID=889300 RepID=UPI002936788B|nr:hypothetical protein [Nitratireductor aquimarinus]MDV2967057.1 hypothetical protein [Nitratireductor aquimarinus]
MRSGLVKPLLVTMLLVAAGDVRASSLLELKSEDHLHQHSTIALKELALEERQPAPDTPPLSYPGPALSAMPEIAPHHLSPSMVDIGAPAHSLGPATGETTSSIPQRPRQLPRVIRGGETGPAAPRSASAPPTTEQATPAAPERRHKAKRRAGTKADNGPAAAPPSAAPPSGQPLGRPE